MASLLNGLSAMGQGIAQSAGAGLQELQRGQLAQSLQSSQQTFQAGLVQQQADLKRQADILADQLATNRALTLQGQQQSFQSSESSKAQASEMARTQATLNAEPADIKAARAVLADPALMKAMTQLQMAKSGMANLYADPTDLSLPAPGSTPAPTPAPTPASGVTGNAAANTTPPSSSSASSPASVDENGNAIVAPPPGANAPPIIKSVSDIISNPDAILANRTDLNNEVLKKFNPAAQTMIKRMIVGLQPPPSGRAAYDPKQMALTLAAGEYDPSFNQSAWTTRNAIARSMADGKIYNTMTSAGKIINHLADLDNEFTDLKNYSGIATIANAPLNYLAKQFGDARQTTVQENIDAVALELRRFFSTAGSGSEKEADDWKANFPKNGSPEQQHAAVLKGVKLMMDQVEPVVDQINSALKIGVQPVNLLPRSVQGNFLRLTGQQPPNTSIYQTGGPPPAPPTSPSAGQPSASPNSQNTAPRIPDVGAVMQGYKFMGGDPSKQESWQKVQ